MNFCHYGCGKEGLFYSESSKRWRCCKNPALCDGRKREVSTMNINGESHKRLKMKYKNCPECGLKVSAPTLAAHVRKCTRKLTCIVCGSEHKRDQAITCSDKCRSILTSETIRGQYADGSRSPRKAKKTSVIYDEHVFDNDVEVLAYKLLVSMKVDNLQHESVRIPYVYEGLDHTYFPDFTYDDGNQKCLVEIKAGGRMNMSNYAKLRAAESLGYKIILWDRNVIKKLSSNKD
jgi:hypothetical protein